MKNKNESLFPFVDNIRLVSMLAVVCYHSFLIIYSTDKNKVTYTLDEQILIFSYTQLMRYGNICFFLVSGLLFGSKMKGIGDQKIKSLEYIKRRVNVLIPPALLFTLIVVVLNVGINIVTHIYKNEPITANNIIVVFFSEWFIFVLIIGLWLIHYLGSSKILLIGMITFSIFWGFDIYLQWIPVKNHYQFASVGFLTYLVIGYHFGLRKELFYVIVNFFRKNLKYALFISFVIYVWSVYDCFGLYTMSPNLPLNSLKLSNQIGAFLMFFIFCVTLDKPILKNILNPRVETIGIYFVHQIILSVYNAILKSILLYLGIHGRAEIPVKYGLPLVIFTALIVYPATLLTVKLMSKTKYSKWIGIVQSQ